MKKNSQSHLPTTPVTKLTRPFLRFMEVEAAGGAILLLCTLLALGLANSPLAEDFAKFWKTPVELAFGDLKLSLTLGYWINDALMAIFFFVVGLEIKRELVAGELKDPRAAMLPIMAALGGMIAPALIYILTLQDPSGHSGWGIPMATDIAFVVGFLSLLGARVPHGLKIFVLSLAIVDDLGAILVIALFYSSNLSYLALGAGLSGLVLTYGLNKLGVRAITVYVLVGVLVWLAFLASGVHPTIAGVLLGLLTPANAWIGEKNLFEAVSDLKEKWTKPQTTSELRGHDIQELVVTARESVSPLERLQIALHPWVAFLIMPIFALSNAGVPWAKEAVTSSISLSVILGLVLGKPIGILLFSWVAVKALGARLPQGVNWPSLLGAGVLCGVGFTMSIFIAGLALDEQHLVAGKVGTLLGSSISTIAGLAILYFALPSQKSNS